MTLKQWTKNGISMKLTSKISIQIFNYESLIQFELKDKITTYIRYLKSCFTCSLSRLKLCLQLVMMNFWSSSDNQEFKTWGIKQLFLLFSFIF